MTVIERKVYVCDIHGETANVVGMGADRPPWCVECRAPVKVVRLVPDEQLAGAVEALRRVEEYCAGMLGALDIDAPPSDIPGRAELLEDVLGRARR